MRRSLFAVLFLVGCNDGEILNPVSIPRDGGGGEITCDDFIPTCDSHLEPCEVPDDCCDSLVFPTCGEKWSCEPCCTDSGVLTQGANVCVSR